MELGGVSAGGRGAPGRRTCCRCGSGSCGSTARRGWRTCGCAEGGKACTQTDGEGRGSPDPRSGSCCKEGGAPTGTARARVEARVAPAREGQRARRQVSHSSDHRRGCRHESLQILRAEGWVLHVGEVALRRDFRAGAALRGRTVAPGFAELAVVIALAQRRDGVLLPWLGLHRPRRRVRLPEFVIAVRWPRLRRTSGRASLLVLRSAPRCEGSIRLLLHLAGQSLILLLQLACHCQAPILVVAPALRARRLFRVGARWAGLAVGARRPSHAVVH